MEKHNESGAALLSVLLIVALISIVALAVTDTTLNTLRQAQTIDRAERLSWHVTSATELGLGEVNELSGLVGRALTINTPGLNEQIITPLGDGIFDGRIQDASNCLNLNSLVPTSASGEADLLALFAYRTLLEAIGFEEGQVNTLVDTLLDWLDGDDVTRTQGAENRHYSQLKPPYRTAGGRMVNMSELRAVSGYTDKVLSVLSPMVCVRPNRDIAQLNVNTLKVEQAALLPVVFSGDLDLGRAEALLANRPLEGWRSVQIFAAEDALSEIPDNRRNLNLISVQTSYLELSARVSSGDVSKEFRTLYLVQDGLPTEIVHHLSGRAP